MAKVILHAGSNMSNWSIGDLADLTPLTEANNFFEADFSASGAPADIFEMRGSDFEYDGDVLPSAGTIKKLMQTDSGVLQWEINKVELDAGEFAQGVEAGDSYAAFSAIFGGNDKLFGSTDDDVIRGYGGDDTEFGSLGNDSLFGDLGNDTLDGEAGNDRLIGGGGQDTLHGAGGADSFAYVRPEDTPSAASERDTILDFNAATGDVINLALIDADKSLGGDQAFTFIGAAAFSDTPGELRYSGSVVRGDIDGDGSADFAIELAGGPAVAAADFIL